MGGREGRKEGGKVKEEEERREAKNESDHLSQSYFVTRPCPHLELVGPTGRRSRYFKKEEEGKGVVTREKKRTKGMKVNVNTNNLSSYFSAFLVVVCASG